MDDLPRMALSIRQPWAWAIVRGVKDIENREWQTRFRGPVCIHASLYKPRQTDVDNLNEVFIRAVPDQEKRKTICPRFTEALSLERGGIIGVAEIVDCVETSDSPWFFGRYGFVLRNVRTVWPIPVKGALGFFDWRAKQIGGGND